MVAVLLLCAVTAACAPAAAPQQRPVSAAATAPSPTEDASTHEAHEATASAGSEQEAEAAPVALRRGERRTTIAVPSAYTPSAPNGEGTDDYRCFLLDPELPQDAWLTGTDIRPGNPDVVHHVILYKVDAALLDQARAADRASDGPGWTCFGGMGLEGELDKLDDAAWLGAWAPGGRETVSRDGYGVGLDTGTRIVMQVHYNLLAGVAPDRSAARIRWVPQDAPAGSDIEAVHTVLLPAPVELPCRPGRDSGPLCSHDASVADAKARFGEAAGQTANLLHLLCGTEVTPTDTTTCDRVLPRDMTILGAAGHMHLLGRWITVVANPGTPREQQLLDVPIWNFDDQAATPIEPLRLRAGDTVQVTCHHDQEMRDLLPALQDAEEKYVVWGEGTTDEMCLGILQAVFDD
ncbi:MAG: hypothetical protein CMH83_05700 [Nocardioides sp.]|nr:hypothetical protein [Nocardioides sp.]